MHATNDAGDDIELDTLIVPGGRIAGFADPYSF
jgi:hypothetical protein